MHIYFILFVRLQTRLLHIHVEKVRDCIIIKTIIMHLSNIQHLKRTID